MEAVIMDEFSFIIKKEPKIHKYTIISGVLFAITLVAILYGGSFLLP